MKIDLDEFIDYLNTLASLDQETMYNICTNHLNANEKLAEFSPTFFGYHDTTKTNYITWIGIINKYLTMKQNIDEITSSDEEFSNTERILGEINRNKKTVKFYNTINYRKNM